MITERIRSYMDNNSFCSEYLFKDWETFLDFIYEEGGRVSSILWWEHCKKNFQHGYGGYSDPDDGEWMYSETWFHEDGFAELTEEKPIMDKLFDFGNRYARESTWKDFALVKFCLFSMGLAAGTQIPEKHKKKAIKTAACVFAATYIPLMTKVFRLAFRRA